jgi:hypothetical protein
MFVPWQWATLFIAIGVLVCAVLTVIPLLRRHPLDAPETDPVRDAAETGVIPAPVDVVENPELTTKERAL